MKSYIMYNYNVNFGPWAYDLHFISFFPENDSEDKANNCCHEKPNSVVLWISPVGPMLFPEASLELSDKWLGVLCGKVKVLGT